MKQYWKNLFLALTGSDPFREELEEAKQQMKKTAENMSSMEDLYFKALERWNAALKDLEESDKRAVSLQVLTENLRNRIKEKDEMIKELQKALDEKGK